MEKQWLKCPGGILKLVKLKSELQWPIKEIQKRIQNIDKERRNERRAHRTLLSFTVDVHCDETN